MKRTTLFPRWPTCLGLTLLGALGATQASAQPQPLPVAKGVYRLPYTDGTSVRFSNDHTNHPTTLNRVDMTGQGGGPFTVVSAGAGWIRIIVENNDTNCPDACGSVNDCNGDGTITVTENIVAQTTACGAYSGPSTFCCERDFESNGGNCPGAGTCQNAPNNFVWIEHPNGEWTKYTHMLRGSVGQGTDVNGNPGAGRFVGEFVAAGTPLGIEGDVGIASGPHVHFEVAFPEYVELSPANIALDDPNSPPATINDWFSNGFLVGDGVLDDVDSDGSDDVNRQNRIPFFCQIGAAEAGDINTAGPCDDLCNSGVLVLSGTISAANSPFYAQASVSVSNADNPLDVEVNSGVSVRAAQLVRLAPGFHAELNSRFSASIGSCDSPGGTGE